MINKSTLKSLITSVALIGCSGPSALSQLSSHEGYQPNGQIIACSKDKKLSHTKALIIAGYKEGIFKIINLDGDYSIELNHNLIGTEITKTTYGDKQVCTKLKTHKFDKVDFNEYEFLVNSCTKNTGDTIKDLESAIIKGTISSENSEENYRIENLKQTSEELCIDIMKVKNSLN